jgi:hypothetical protein
VRVPSHFAGVEVEDAAHDGRLDRVRNQYVLFVREEVAERGSAAEPAALLRPALDPRRDAIDDGGVLELGEHGQHLQHHPPGGRAGVERLGRRAEDNPVGVKLLGQLGELAHLPREAVDAVDEQQVGRAGAGEFERRLQALWYSDFERGVVEVLGCSLLEPRDHRLENASVQPHGMTASPEREPVEVNASSRFTVMKG